MIKNPEYKLDEATKIRIDCNPHDLFPGVDIITFFTGFGGFLWYSAIQEIVFAKPRWFSSLKQYKDYPKPDSIIVQRTTQGWCFEFSDPPTQLRADFVASFEKALQDLKKWSEICPRGKKLYLKK